MTKALLENKETIIMGDINCDLLNNGDQKEIKYILKGSGMKQIIKSPTRITQTTKTLIDIIATTHMSMVISLLETLSVTMNL